MFKIIMANVLVITGRVWGQVTAGKTCVGGGHELWWLQLGPAGSKTHMGKPSYWL